MQIYNMKKRLSRVLIKFFYINLSPQIKLFNYQLFSTAMIFEKFSLYLRDLI